MHSMYKLKHPDKSVSYETYRTIFSTDFNISFGYPRSDTCSKCDEFNARLKSLNLRLTQNITLETKEFLNRKIRKLTIEKELHKKKKEVFYARKRQARLQSRKSLEIEAVAMDYQKNLPVPNITTNDVYYKRQLSFYSFNIHRLSDADSVFYTYSEEIAKKGSNEVCSFLEDYVTHHLSSSVKILIIFCDSCGGQNKNFTVFRYLHYLVHQKKRFQTIKVVFPIRGHSYMECDKNMGIINCKSKTELPSDWVRVFKEARVKPSPFKIEEVNDSLIRDWGAFLSPLYVNKCPFLSRPIRELEVTANHPRMILHRETYNGSWTTSIVTKPVSKLIRGPPLPEKEFHYPPRAYYGKIPITREKYNDLQQLKKFCDESTFSFYDNLPVLPTKKNSKMNKKEKPIKTTRNKR